MKNTFHLISALKNGYKASKSSIRVHRSKKNLSFLKILQKYGFIDRFSLVDAKSFNVFLKYSGQTAGILSIHKISRPSLPIYFSVKDLWKFHKTYGILIVHTSHGLRCHHEALQQKLGGQLLCTIV